MVVLSKIYTRTGDDGTTALGDFSRTSKNDPRLLAYADVDEAGAAIGLATTCADDLPDELRPVLNRIQNDLFDVGADLSTPLVENNEDPGLRVRKEWVDELEQACDHFGDELPDLRSFVLAGGTQTSAYLHVARTIVRRAERSVWAAIEVYGTSTAGGINPLTATYLNRLSDALFIFARYANASGDTPVGDVLWEPAGGRYSAPSSGPEATS